MKAVSFKLKVHFLHDLPRKDRRDVVDSCSIQPGQRLRRSKRSLHGVTVTHTDRHEDVIRVLNRSIDHQVVGAQASEGCEIGDRPPPVLKVPNAIGRSQYERHPPIEPGILTELPGCIIGPV